MPASVTEVTTLAARGRQLKAQQYRVVAVSRPVPTGGHSMNYLCPLLQQNLQVRGHAAVLDEIVS